MCRKIDLSSAVRHMKDFCVWIIPLRDTWAAVDSTSCPSASGNINALTHIADKNFYLYSASLIDLYLLSLMRKPVIEGCVWVCVLVCMTDTWIVFYSLQIVPPWELFSSVIAPCHIEWLTVWLSFNGLQGERGSKGVCGPSGQKGDKVSNKEKESLCCDVMFCWESWILSVHREMLGLMADQDCRGGKESRYVHTFICVCEGCDSSCYLGLIPSFVSGWGRVSRSNRKSREGGAHWSQGKRSEVWDYIKW